MTESKPFCISKWTVLEAWRKVRANKGATGVDDVSIKEFEKRLKNNLYRIWNRMSSGSYVPPPVLRVMIPKADGKQRPLGIPTVGDRVAQMVVKLELEPKVEPLFHPDSYGYRPGKSALDAVGTCRKRCWRYDWVVDLDIKGFFDNIDHSLMMHAVRKHTDCPWVLLYIERWLKAPAQIEDGTLLARDRGTPQGGVISPLLANIFLHHVFDAWISQEYPGCPFERYADDVVIHCSSQQQALAVKAAVEARLRRCKLEAHPDKTRIVYCRDDHRRQDHEHIQFDFLSYTFRPSSAASFRQSAPRQPKPWWPRCATGTSIERATRNWLTYPGCSIRSSGAGWPTTGGTIHRPCSVHLPPSIGGWCAGHDPNTSHCETPREKQHDGCAA
jgi:group II intron reverse transcriptase/maturase